MSVGLIKKQKQLEIDAKNLIPNIAGCITSYSARKKETNIDNAFSQLSKDMQVYFYNKNTDFSNAVNKKMAILNESGVVNNE